MKRFTSFLCSLLLAVFAMAQSETTIINVVPGDGNYNGASWCSNWTSTSVDYPVAITVGVNNLYAATTSGGFQMARGSNADSDWTFSVAGYKVVSYSFKFKSYEDGKDVTLSATDADGSAVSMTSSYSTEQTFSIDCSSAATATFRISGSNNSIIATDLTLTVRPAQALTSLEVGQVYRFVNVLYPTYSLNANAANDVNAVTTNETDTKQQWYVEKQDGEYYVLRNLAYGKYLKGNGQSTAWSMSDDYSHDYNKFKLYTSNTDYNTLHTNTLGNKAYIHCNSSYNIVGWSNDVGDKGSHWEITKVDYTAEQITALLEKAPTVAEVAAYPAALEAIFTDGACTTLNSAYTTTSMTDEQLAADANYSALPQTLKNMVKKVRGGNWAEETVALDARPNGNNSSHGQWDVYTTWEHDYAKKFRVQMYEPYSVEGEITSFLGINAHCNMDNPTGIYANAGEPIYIMVEGDIAEGAELWVAHQTGHGVTEYYSNAAYTQLKKGLNVIPYASDGCQLWINYLVHTYNTSTGEFPNKLSDYKPLKIHIEGGHINGFFNAMGDFRAEDSGTENLWGEVDNDADWDYYKARVALATDFALLGHRQTLLFPFGTWNSTNGYFGVANDAGGIEKALAWHLEEIEVPTTPNCYAGSGNAFGDFSDTYYPGMNLVTNGTRNKINIMLEAWDRIMYSEHATMGLLSKSNIDKMNSLYPGWTAEKTTFDIYNYGSNDTGDTYKAFCEGRDYSDYYNHHGAAVGSGSGYMSGGWRVCNYHYNTMGSIIGKIAVEAGPTWGPAHEIGHQHQKIFNLNGQTEVTNNFFSNVAVWYMGMGTSRVNGTDGSLDNLLSLFNNEDVNQYLHMTQGGNIWALTHLYYRLWLYYHLAGNNTQFWPRLFELCRQTPLENGTQISGETSLLRFYQHACDAAGEDLTEFFRAHGYFDVMDNVYVGDYTNATYNMTEEQIKTAIKAVEAKNYPVNYAVLLINDATSKTTLKHDGTSKRALWDTNASAEYGSVNDFIEGNTSVTEAYTAVVGNDGTVTMSGGAGGVGFLVFNEDGELVSFSNKSTFELSDEAKKTILQGNATFVAVDSENNTTTAEIDLTAMQRTILAELIAMAQQIIDKIDDTYTKIGFYKGAAVADLALALENAKTVYDAGTSGYGAAYDLLYAEYNKLLENEDARIPFDPSLTYIITNKAYTNQTMWVNDELTVRSEGGVDQTADAARWQFKPTASGAYNIYNMKGYYCPAVSQSASMTATETPNADALYTLQEMEAGVWAIKLSPAAGYRNFHSSGSNVVGWETGNNATRWYLTAVEPNATIADLTNLEVYITKTEALLGEVLGTVTYTRGENIDLQTTTEGSARYIWSNAPCATEGNITNLVDGATNNYFHTEWDGDAVTSGDHYIAVDLGAGNTLPRFAFSHTTRSGAQNDFPKSVDVYGSDDNVTYKYLGSASDMPQSAGAFWQFDGMIISSHRYLRFNMHANRGYWHMAEFDIMPVTSFTATVNDTYNGIVSVATVTTALEAVYNGKGVTLSMSPTEDNINEKLGALTSAYDALYNEYKAAITARKNTLAQLAANTQEIIEIAGTVEFGSNVTKLTLTTENLYCNAPHMGEGSDYSAEYVTKLTDGSATTFLHTDYSGSVAAPHYLRVYLGENSAVKSFKFNYTTRDNGNDCPTTILIEGSNEPDDGYTTIKTLTAAANGLPNPDTNAYGGVADSFESLVISMGAAYKYVRFKVTGVEGGNARFFVMSEFGFSTVEDVIAVNSKYKSVVTEELLLASVHTTNSSAAMSTNALVTSVPMLDAQIADQQAAYDKLNEAMQQATCDKTELQAAYDEALALYNKMADGEGNVTSDYAPSTLTVEQLAAAKTALDAAKEKLDNSSEQDEIDTAKGNLETAFEPLNTVESLNVAATKDKSTLNALIASTNTLLGTINGNIENNSNYYASSSLALDELNTALQNAQDAVSRYYLTETQYTAAYEALNDCYTAANAVVIADVAKDELKTLIDNVNTLLGTIAEDCAAKNVAVPLQSTESGDDFYIWCNSPAGDSQGVAGLIDKNADGTANTGTFLGTSWGSTVAAYTHYIEVDLGEGITIDKLLFDYTTRNSTHDNQRPTAIKILGSNDKTDYTEITIISEGLATEQCQQWSMAETLELGAPYRYIRFAVATQESTGYFNMSDFNLYALIGHTLALKEYYTTAAGLELDALCIALQSAEYAAEHYLTTDRLTEVKNMLNGYYTAANTIVGADVKDRTELATLATTTEELVTEVATINEAETAITMQCTDETAPYYLYCNADGTTHTTYPNDAKGVDALLDDDATNHLHTTYEGAADDNLDHYLRLDMGENEAMMSFKFSYTGRSGNNNNAPKTMVIEGSNNLNDFEEIATLTDLPTTDATVTYTTSEALGNGKAYRYIRFMVTETKNNDKYQGHPFFVLSQFAVTACKTIEVSEDYESPNLPLNTLVVANNETVDANALVEEPTTYVSQSTYTNAITELQAAYDALNTAKMLKDLPVTLTTDVNNPVLYKIKVKSNSNVFKYDGEADSGTKNLVLAANETGDKYQAWYFMQGDNENSYDDIVIMPYYHQGAKNTEYKLGYPNIDGATKPLASVSGASSYNWYITFTSTGNNVTTEGWWNLQPENGTSDNTFLNQQGGGSSTTLSFWKSAANPNDNGSQFQFVLDETDYSKSDAYFTLYNEHASCGGTKVGGTAIGCYSEASVNAYNTAYNAATVLLENVTATDDEYMTATTDLENAFNALERNMPVEGGFYKIRSAYKKEGVEQYSYGGVVYINDENAMMWAKNYDETSSRAIWYFTPVDGGYNISSMHTGAYAPSLGSGSQGVAADEAKKYTIEILDDVTGVLKIKSPDQPMHAQENGNKLVGWGGGLNSASAWYIEEVDVKTEIGQSITLNTAEGEDKSYSTFYSAYPVTLPDGVEASVVTARADNGQLSMTVITDEYNRVVPAYTAVVLSENKQDASDSSSSSGAVKFSDDASPAEVAEDGNMLSGTLTTEYIDCTAPSTFVYSLGRKNNRVAMYKAYKNYEKVTADNGTVTYNKLGSSSNEGGYVKLGANKSYLKVEGQNNAAVAMFSFFFGGGTTDIDGINAVAEAYEAVYDLQGRKLEKVTEPGIYIVNGKKVYVSEVE